MKLKQVVLVLIVASGTLVMGCNSQAKKDAAAKAKIETVLPPGVSVHVKDGVATLSGQFSDDQTKTAVEGSIASVENIKSVSNNATVVEAPVIHTDQLIQSGVAALMSEYPGVTAIVDDGVVKVSGEISKENWIKLKQALDGLRPKSVDNSLLVIK